VLTDEPDRFRFEDDRGGRFTLTPLTAEVHARRARTAVGGPDLATHEAVRECYLAPRRWWRRHACPRSEGVRLCLFGSEAVAQDSATDSRAETAAERLKAIRARVAELHRRITAEKDPKAVAELRAEGGKLTALIAELVQASGGKAAETKKAGAVVWPRDLSAEPEGTPDWGADPSEVAGD
jgi:hypothetical protein